jgi:ZIP family zinc transporter
MMAAAPIIPIALAMGAALTTYVGGRAAMRFSGHLLLLFGLTAGVVLGIALFDLLPEALGLGGHLLSVRTLLAALAGGLATYMMFDRLLTTNDALSTLRHHLGPASLTVHSFIDGMGIGLAFQVSLAAGVVIAIAVLAHDFADGVNTVGLALTGERKHLAHRWLIADSIAPVFGSLVGTSIQLGDQALSLLFAAFAGAFLYIGACELMPRSFTNHQRLAPTFATIFGIVAAYGIVQFAR